MSIYKGNIKVAGGGGGTWGSITGTLSDQTDLQTALDNKADKDLSNATPLMNVIENRHTVGYKDFTGSNYIEADSTWNFGGGSSYEFVLHFLYGSQYGSAICNVISSNYQSDGGFNLIVNSGDILFLSQTEKENTTSWGFDDALATLTPNTEYWFKMTWNGTVYTYITATDKDFTQIVNTVTFSSNKQIATPLQVARFGATRTYYDTHFYGTIFISDCYLKIDGVKVFDGSDTDEYTVHGSPTLVEGDLLQTEGAAYVVESYQKDYSWYRVWSDGYCEQGGRIPLESGSTSISLLKPYSNTEYTMRMTNMVQSYAVWLDGDLGLDYFKIYSSATGGSLYWETKGYLQPESES